MNRTCSESAAPLRPPGKVLCRFRVTPTLLVSLAAGLVLTTTSCKKATPPSLPPPVVQVAEVTLTNVPISSEFIGQLDSPQNVEVRARVEAFVDKMLFTEGTEVKEGDPLFALDKLALRGAARRGQKGCWLRLKRP